MMHPTPGLYVFGQQMRRDDQMLYRMIKPSNAAGELGLRREHIWSRTIRHDASHDAGAIRRHPAISPEARRSDLEAAASLQAEPFDVLLDRIIGNARVGSRMQDLRDFQRLLVTRLDCDRLVDLPDYLFRPHMSLAYEANGARNGFRSHRSAGRSATPADQQHPRQGATKRSQLRTRFRAKAVRLLIIRL
jgi:2'-5' RNA ligase